MTRTPHFVRYRLATMLRDFRTGFDMGTADRAAGSELDDWLRQHAHSPRFADHCVAWRQGDHSWRRRHMTYKSTPNH